MVLGLGQNLIFSIKYMSASCHTEISFTPTTVNWDICDKIMKHYYIILYYLGDQIKNNEIWGACSIYGGKGEVHTGKWWENLRERDHLQELGINGKIILK
jgi:hypothetical protein